ncbi:MAG: two component transcriptional regulator, winged helix family [Acidobacteriaceae bacterium]|nr:two component transcriptional regulator, winged helix family [Acidobacteriaceae bacterium]
MTTNLPYNFLTFTTQALALPVILRNHQAGDPLSLESQTAASILVVEDDPRTGDNLVAGLTGNGYRAILARTGEEAFFLIHSDRPDLVLLDLTLPQRGGLEILAMIRTQQNPPRVLILTSHNSVEDRVAGLNAGADDYLGKPFSFPELLARVASLLRRVPTPPRSSTLEIADVQIDRNARTISRSGVPIELTPREYDLFLYLLEHRNDAVSREMLAKDVWRETSRFTPIDNVIDVQMTRLRRKIDDPFPIKLLHTLRGIGFILREPEQ